MWTANMYIYRLQFAEILRCLSMLNFTPICRNPLAWKEHMQSNKYKYINWLENLRSC